jgi:Sulfotransferase family
MIRERTELQNEKRLDDLWVWRSMSEGFRFLMISAMYENGGNTTQRLLDGHPELISYPFESQLGTRLVGDHLLGLYPAKYRWPVFPLDGTAARDYELIIDEECKVRIKTPESSKFRNVAITLGDAERKRLFLSDLESVPRTRGALVAAFFKATAEAWKDRARSSRERVYVGYSPIVGVDAEQILGDLPLAHVVNIVRNPWSAYADTKKRPVPLSLAHYMTGWCVHQTAALVSTQRFPDRAHILRYEDIIANPVGVLSDLLARLGVGGSPSLDRPSWNGKVLDEVYPWGTIRVPTPAVNAATARELSRDEADEIHQRTGPLLPAFRYERP